ncbi:O-acetylhomoserine aminocarboxypropyltransferase/cysteine synthase family protein [Microbacterium sp. 18062]|uniref:O-acetylhomoserine aminocarboxypropyltransferase/cysteine synthase family protein n=1 Tax=Microbacterium sp. 18062 TaxID=2681410 RepID=UPI001F472C7E|nr:O-acetylhomoserine aminocarboxypropyltransferase/cysteine synthase family protein [Microbacterium sp. 18062]
MSAQTPEPDHLDPTGFATRQVRAGYRPGTPQNTAVPPIYQSVAYEFESFAAARDIFALRRTGNLYSRTANPTQLVLEERLAALDEGVAALATASGQSAVAIALLSLARTGEHIVAARQLYGGTVDLLTDTFADFGIEVTLVDQDDLDAWRAAIRPTTRALFGETIGNPVASVLPVAEIAGIAHAAGVPLVVDNTIATPYLQQPKRFGADIVVYSATKFIGGHGTSLGGVIVDLGTFDFGAEAERWPQFTQPYPRVGDVVLWERFGRERSALLVYAKTKLVHDLGPSLSPFNAFQLLQGLETLDLRLERQNASAARIAAHLAEHPSVARVHHPSLPGNRWHDAAARYLPRGAGSVFSFDLATGDAHVEQVIDGLRHFALVANIGDARSLVVHPATTTHSHFDDEQLAQAGFGRGTVRLSIGLEDVRDLIADLDNALALVPKE